MRLFLALGVPATTARDIADWRERCATASGRAVPAANFHVTLAFIGQLQSHRLEALCDAIAAVCESGNYHTDALLLDQVGYWPKPGIFWLGPSHWPDTVTKLAAKLRNSAASFGASKDKRAFQPHVTLYRSCVLPPPAPLVAPEFSFSFDHVILFESHNSAAGVSYHSIAEFTLPQPHGQHHRLLNVE